MIRSIRKDKLLGLRKQINRINYLNIRWQSTYNASYMYFFVHNAQEKVFRTVERYQKQINRVTSANM